MISTSMKRGHPHHQLRARSCSRIWRENDPVNYVGGEEQSRGRVRQTETGWDEGVGGRGDSGTRTAHLPKATLPPRGVGAGGLECSSRNQPLLPPLKGMSHPFTFRACYPQSAYGYSYGAGAATRCVGGGHLLHPGV